MAGEIGCCVCNFAKFPIKARLSRSKFATAIYLNIIGDDDSGLADNLRRFTPKYFLAFELAQTPASRLRHGACAAPAAPTQGRVR